MPGIRPPKQLTFGQIDRLLKKELGAVYASHNDKEVAQDRMREPAILPEEEETMGLFDELMDDGLVFDDIPLDPWAFDDDKYRVVLETIEYDPSEDTEKFAHKLKVEYRFHETELKYKNRKYRQILYIPGKDYQEKKEGSKDSMVAKTVQMLFALGLVKEEIRDMNVVEMNNKLRGNEYIIELNTPKDNNPQERQFLNSVKKFRGDTSASSVLDM